MIHRRFTTALLAATLVAAPVTRAAANDAFFGAVVGSVVGTAIANSGKTQKKTYTKRSYSNYSSSTKEVQNSLNYFGFPAGYADGKMGSKTRSAISSFQAFMGYPVTGQLTEYERNFLTTSYGRAQAGGPTTAELIASNPQGIRGLLIVYRDEQVNGSPRSIAGHYGLPKVVAAAVNEIAKSSDPSAEQLVQRSGFIQLSDINGDGQTDYVLDTSVTGSAFWCNAQSCAVRVFASTPDGYIRNDFQAFNVVPAMFACTRGTCTMKDDPKTQMAVQQTPQLAPSLPETTPVATVPSAPGMAQPVPTAQTVVRAPEAAQPTMPSFFAQGGAKLLSSHCRKVALATGANGGMVTAAALTDPSTALNEQFCLARDFAIEDGQQMIAALPGFTFEQVAAQCAGLVPLYQGAVTDLSLKPRAAVLDSTRTVVAQSGLTPDNAIGTAKICLSVGYTQDDMALAVSSVLILAALGEEAYGELAGHHLSQGFGAATKVTLAMEWYDAAMAAAADPMTAVFAPGQAARVDVLTKAVDMLGGRNTGAVLDTGPAAQPVAMPTFFTTAPATGAAD